MEPHYYQFEPYYRVIVTNLIKEKMKRGDVNSLSDTSGFIHEILQMGYELSDHEEKLLSLWLSHVLEFNFIEEILSSLEDESVEEVILHNDSWVQVIGKDRKEFYGPFLKGEDYQLSLEVFALKEKQLWNRATPFQSFQCHLFQRRWRAGLMHKSLSGLGLSKLFLRTQKNEEFPLSAFNLTEGQVRLIENCLQQKKNILICGATGSGKTSFLKSLTKLIPEREHIITLEDTSELALTSPFATQLLSSPEEGKTLVDFCHYALRMRPDRLILGEIRSDEVVPFLLSINTGHGGMMASLHANGAIDAIHRLCLLFQIYSQQTTVSYPEVLKLVCQGVDFIFHLEEKRVVNILEVKGSEGTTPYYELWN